MTDRHPLTDGIGPAGAAADRATATDGEPGRDVPAGAQAGGGLLCQPYLLDPDATGVYVVWHTETPGTTQVVLVGTAVAAMTGPEARDAATAAGRTLLVRVRAASGILAAPSAHWIPRRMRLDPFPFPTTATGTSPVLPTCLPCNARATGRAGRPPRACRPEPGA